MVIKITQPSSDSVKTEKVEVGEIDTTAPFASVKAAVSLFGAKATSKKPTTATTSTNKTKLPPVENVFAKEAQLHLAQKELNILKEQLKNADETKAQALAELENSKIIVEDLTSKLKAINESKEVVNKVIEDAKDQVKHLDEAHPGSPAAFGNPDELEARQQYANVAFELDSAKQEFIRVRQDLETFLEAKAAAFQQTEEALNSAKENAEKADDITKEITAAQDSLVQMKLASAEAHQEQAKILSERDTKRQSEVAVLEEKIVSLKNEIDSKASDTNCVEAMLSELSSAKEKLQELVNEKTSLTGLMKSLEDELESVKKEHSTLKEKEAEHESFASNLEVELQKSKAELEAAHAEEQKEKGESDDKLTKMLKQLSWESENARKEAEEKKKTAEELKKEADMAKISLEEAKKKLEVMFKEHEEAKAAEAQALDQVKVLLERKNAAIASTSEFASTEFASTITISTHDFETLNRKVKECEASAKVKEDAVMAQVEALRASESEVLKNVETSRKEIDELKAAAEEALKRVERAEAARNAIEGELKKWGEQEQKDRDGAAQHSPDSIKGIRKVDKKFGSRKFFSGIFHRKKSVVESGSFRFPDDISRMETRSCRFPDDKPRNW